MCRMRFFSSLLGLSVLLSGSMLHAQEPLQVTATFSILGDLIQQVGGDKVHVTTLVGPDGDAHVYQPSPQDVRTLAQSKLLVSNGLGFEGWLDRLAQSSGFKGTSVVASQGITPLHRSAEHGDDGHQHQGDMDPHAWNDANNVLVYVDNIAQGLGQADPANAALYAANAASYKAQVMQLDMRYKIRFNALPEAHRKAITSHDAFGYLAHAYHLTLLAPQGMNTDAEPSAAQVANLIRQIRQQKIPALFVENISDPRLMEQIASETQVKIGGKLYSDALSGPQGEAPSYLAFLEHNLSTLLKALEP